MTRILWLRPPTPDGTSPGRHDIAKVLRNRGYAVTVKDASMASPHLKAAKLADVMIGTTRSGAFDALWSYGRTRTPFVVDHVDPISQLKRTGHPIHERVVARGIETLAFVAAEHVVYVPSEDERRVRRWGSNVSQTTLGVHADRFEPPEMPPPAPHELEGPVAVYAGTLNEQYHVDAMLAAVKDSQWSLAVIGDGPKADDMRQAANARTDVAYGGAVAHDRVPDWLWTANVGLCLVADARTVKMLEYGAAMLPVVQLDCSDARKRWGDAVTYTEANGPAVASALDTARNTGPSEVLRGTAQRHDYERVADVYESAIVEVTTP